MIRLVVRIAWLVVALGLLVSAHRGGALTAFVPALSVFTALTSVVANRMALPLASVGLVVVALVMLRHRWFCRWGCPMGLCCDGAGWLGGRLGRRPAGRMPSVGQWIVLITLGGAILGYPLLLWLDPLAIFSGAASPAVTGLGAGIWFMALLIIVPLILSLLWPGLWCVRICPLGASQDILYEVRRACDNLAERVSGKGSSEKQVDPAGKTGRRIIRRAVISLPIGAGLAAVMGFARRHPTQVIRPPGAIDESRFAATCMRCGACMRACPAGIIRPNCGGTGMANLLTPELLFNHDYCREDCVRCTTACPSGALTPMLLEQKPMISIGLAAVDMDICVLGEDGECAACMRWCPYGAIRYVWSEETYSLRPEIYQYRCNGCGACEKACPTRPQRAIKVRPR